MKEMIYTHEEYGEIIEEGTIDGYDWIIVSYGMWPAAYVKLQQDHPYYNKSYDDMNITAHGDITFAEHEYHPHIDGIEPRKGFWIGWGYDHLKDFTKVHAERQPYPYEKVWTTEEIFEHVKSVIEQLKNIKLKGE